MADLDKLQFPSLTKEKMGMEMLTKCASLNPFLSTRDRGLHFFTMSLIAHNKKVQSGLSQAGSSRGMAN